MVVIDTLIHGCGRTRRYPSQPKYNLLWLSQTPWYTAVAEPEGILNNQSTTSCGCHRHPDTGLWQNQKVSFITKVQPPLVVIDTLIYGCGRTRCILICRAISLSLYFIILDKDSFVKVSHYKWVLLKLGEFFLVKILQKGAHSLTKVRFLYINK